MEISLSGSGEGLGRETGRRYSTNDKKAPPQELAMGQGLVKTRFPVYKENTGAVPEGLSDFHTEIIKKC